MMKTRNTKSLSSVDIEDLILTEAMQTPKRGRSPARSPDSKSRKQKSTSKQQRKSSSGRSRSQSKSPSRGRPMSKGTPKSKSKQAKPQEESKSKSRSRSRTKKSQSKSRNDDKSPEISKRPVRRIQTLPPEMPSNTSETSSKIAASDTRQRVARSETVVEENQILKEHKEKATESSVTVSKLTCQKTVKVKVVLKKIGTLIVQMLCAMSVAVFLNGFVLYAHLNCSKGPNACLMNRLPAFPSNILTLFNAASFATLFAFVFFQFAIALLPFGKVCGDKYRANGVICLSLNLVLFGVAAFVFGKDQSSSSHPLTDLYTKQTQFATSAAILALILCLAFYLKTLAHKPSERSAGVLNDLVYGREVSPKIGGSRLHLKNLITLRVGHYLAVLLCLSYVLTDYKAKSAAAAPSSSVSTLLSSLNWPLLIITGMQLCYVTLVQILEEDLLESMLVKRDTLSYAKLVHHLVITPFVMTLPGRFVLEHQPEIGLPCFCALSCLVPFVIGAVIFYQANHQKGIFKRNPDHPDASHLLSITSGRGDREVKLICSGLFRFVRHPNYFADLLMHLAMSFLTGFVSAIPYLPFMYLLAYSVYRIVRMEKMLCTRSPSSGSAWNQYTKQVPKRLLLKLF